MSDDRTYKDTRQLFRETLERMRNEPPNSRPPQKLSPEEQEAWEALDRVLGLDKQQSEKADAPPTPDSTKAEKELAQLSDLLEGERRDDWFADPPENCDFCQVDLPKRCYFVDGKLKGSIGWANMCAECFFANGEGIGWGHGQAYLQKRPNEWLMVGGFPPYDAAD